VPFQAQNVMKYASIRKSCPSPSDRMCRSRKTLKTNATKRTSIAPAASLSRNVARAISARPTAPGRTGERGVGGGGVGASSSGSENGVAERNGAGGTGGMKPGASAMRSAGAPGVVGGSAVAAGLALPRSRRSALSTVSVAVPSPSTPTSAHVTRPTSGTA
jgi:hypothetical protein